MNKLLLHLSALCVSAIGLSSPLAAADEKPIPEKETRIVSGYLLNNNVWGKDKSPDGWQLIDVVKPGEKLSWAVRYNWPVGTDRNSVKCYPSVVTGWQWGAWSGDGRLPVPVSELGKMVSGAAVKLQNPGVQNVAYDLWFHAAAPVRSEDKPSDELMIWMERHGGAGPLGKLREKVRIDGVEWSLYVGDIGWKVFSFVREENATSWRVDAKAFIDHLVRSGLMLETKQFSSIQFGTEVFSSPGDGRLDVTDYFVEIEKRPAAALAQGKPEAVSAERARANFARPVVLAPDDVRAFPDAPAGFDQPRAGAAPAHVEAFAYDSSITGTRRAANVYLPPGYSAERKYPVLYLLHGIAGNQHEWTGYVHADTIVDNLIAAEKAVPMIVVMPNGCALADDRPPPPDKTFTPERVAGFAKFERDLLDCLIPAIQEKYSVYTDREHRALAGLSMGGGQTLNFGFAHLDTFAWLGGFSSAPTVKPLAELIPDPAAASRQLKLMYLSCGNKDGLINGSQNTHVYLKEHHVPHLWNVDGFGHDRETWANNLHHFAQLLFR